MWIQKKTKPARWQTQIRTPPIPYEIVVGSLGKIEQQRAYQAKNDRPTQKHSSSAMNLASFTKIKSQTIKFQILQYTSVL